MFSFLSLSVITVGFGVEIDVVVVVVSVVTGVVVVKLNEFVPSDVTFIARSRES